MDFKENEIFNGTSNVPNDDVLQTDYMNLRTEQPVMEVPVVEPTMGYTMSPEMVTEPVETVAMPEFEMPAVEEVAPVVETPVMEVPVVEPMMGYTMSPEMVTEPVETVTMPEFEMPAVEDVAPVVETPVMEMASLEEVIAPTVEQSASTPQQVNEQGKVVNHELLKNLAEDTNNMVNPNMLVSPLGKQNEEKPVEIEEEPKVNYDKIKDKKNLILIVAIFLVILAFILLLPYIF